MLTLAAVRCDAVTMLGRAEEAKPERGSEGEERKEKRGSGAVKR